MALTRRSLKAMGLTEEQVESVVEMHSDTVDGLKAELNTYKADAEKVPALQRELDALKAADNSSWEEQYNALKAEHEAYKAEVEAKETQAAKENAVRAYFASRNIEGANLNLAMRSSGAEIAAVELDGDKIKDTSALDALIAGDYAGLVTSKGVKVDTGAKLTTGGKAMTKEEIVAIKDGTARRKAMLENPELFGLDANTN